MQGNYVLTKSRRKKVLLVVSDLEAEAEVGGPLKGRGRRGRTLEGLYEPFAQPHETFPQQIPAKKKHQPL